MCCSSKKKVIDPATQVKQPVQPTANTVVVQPVNPAQSKVVVTPVALSGTTVMTNSNLRNSRLPIDKTLQKSKVKLQEIQDPSVVNFFKDCKTQRIQLTKVTNEHNSYVRQHDYFDLSTGHENELRNLKGLADVRGANYGVEQGSTLSTPSINKFYYDREIVDVGYVPANTAYRPQYSIPVATGQSAYHGAETVTYVNNNNVNYNTNSTVQPFGGQGQAIGTYSTVQPVHPAGTYSTVQPAGTYSTVQPVVYKDSYVSSNSGMREVI